MAEAAPARLLIRAPNWLGDAVMALPAMAAFRAAYPDTRITVAAPAAVAPIFAERTSAGADAVLVVDQSTAVSRLAAGGFEAAVLFPNSFRTAWQARQAGIRERWGYARSFRGPLLTRGVRPPRGRLHQADYYRHLARQLGASEADGQPGVSVVAETLGRAATLLEQAGVTPDSRLVGLAPGAAYGHAKRWPPARVAALVDRLAREQAATCVLVGAAGDREAGRAIESALPATARVVNLIGRTDLRLLAGVIASCRTFVSNDSGAMHLAAALGVPVVAIFGPTDERATAPVGVHTIVSHPVFCRPCMLRDCPIDHRCMTRIGVDDVHAAVSGYLGVTA
jgi:heptosyltransferase-2